MSASPVIASVPDTRGRAWAYATASAFAGGLLLGVLSNVVQGWLPGAWNQIANSGAVWSVAAFVAGALLSRKVGLTAAAVAGLLAESGLVVGYYSYAEVARDGVGSLFAPLIWLAMALVAGPLFGVAGFGWRGLRPRHRVTPAHGPHRRDPRITWETYPRITWETYAHVMPTRRSGRGASWMPSSPARPS